MAPGEEMSEFQEENSRELGNDGPGPNSSTFGQSDSEIAARQAITGDDCDID